MLVDICYAASSVTLIDRISGNFRRKLVKELKPQSLDLFELSMSFEQRGNNIKIVSFHEEQAMRGFTEAVSRSILQRMDWCSHSGANLLL